MESHDNGVAQGFLLNELFDKKVKIMLPDFTENSKSSVKLSGLGAVKNLNQEIISRLQKSIGLLFLEKIEDGNVCFANNNEDLRNEFKQVFSPGDVLDYVYGILNSPTYPVKDQSKNMRIPYPENAEIFWQKSELGRMFRSY
jgi:hypothetical protein